MGRAKHYEIKLSKKQAFLTVITLIICFLLTFALGAFTGIRFFGNFLVPLQTTSDQDKAIAPSVPNSGALESRAITNPEGDKVIHEFTFYETLPENEDSPLPEKPASISKSEKKRAGEKKSQVSAGEGLPQKYTIQFGSFQQREKADALANKLNKQGYLVYVTTTHLESRGTFYRVRMGSFATKEEAQRLAAKLKGISPPPFITSIK